MSFKSIGLSVQKKLKIELKMASRVAILDFWLERFYFDLQVTPMLPTKFQVNGLLVHITNMPIQIYRRFHL